VLKKRLPHDQNAWSAEKRLPHDRFPAKMQQPFLFFAFLFFAFCF